VWGNERYFTSPAGTAEFRKPKEYLKECNARAIADLRAKYGAKIDSFSDVQLIKFSIARKFDMPKVCLMIDKHLQWVELFKPTFEEFFPDGMAQDYPAGFSGGRDREGNLLYFERPGNAGKCHPADFVNKYGLQTIARWHVASMEYGKQLLADTGFKSKRVTYVIDLSNLGDCGRPMIQFAKTIAAIDQDNYPEHLARLFIINAPSFFATVWKIVRFFVDDRTKTKVFILDAKHANETLTHYVDPSELPSFAGGKNENWFSRGGRIGSDDPKKVVQGAVTEVVADVDDAQVDAAAD
jgi:hypothetical protein